MKDNRYVYGATCSFMGTINKAAKTEGPVSIPCCPYCKGGLFEEDKDEWWAQVEGYQNDEPCPGYVDFLKWVEQEPNCSPHLKDKLEIYNKTFDKQVKW